MQAAQLSVRRLGLAVSRTARPTAVASTRYLFWSSSSTAGASDSATPKSAADAEGAHGMTEGGQQNGDAAATSAVSAEDVKRLQEALQQQDAKAKELEDKYRRALAEVENVRARGRKDTENAKLYAVQKFAKEMAEIADILLMAINSVPEDKRKGDDNSTLRDLFDGVSMTERALMKALERHGVVAFDPLGKPFDPNYHNALMEIDDPSKEAGTVAFVQKRGYLLHERPLRAADVGIVKRR